VRAVDTNIIVRYLTNDDPQQAAVVEQFFDECARTHEKIYVSVPVLCEVIWVLERPFRQTKDEIIYGIEKLLAFGSFQFFQFDCDAAVRTALARYRRGRASLADYLIGELAAQAGCRDTVTFDRGLRGASGFTML
jgi:predicted nucleic-acid-binding protein